MNKNPSSQILDHVARDQMAANTDLAPRILARIQNRKSAKMNPRIKIVAAAVVVLLVIVTVLMNVPAVRAAIQSWFGYVPGIGLVSEGQIRVLAEPVSVTRDGITLKIEHVLVDSTQTTIVYSVEGLAMEMLDNQPNWNSPGCYTDPTLRLPEDKLSSTKQIGTSWITGYQHKTIYPAIPATVNEATFIMPCIRSAIPGKAPENWDLSFRLIPVPPNMTAFPVIEISTPVAETPTVLSQTEPMTDLSADGISLVLDRAVQMNDGYLIYASLHWENSMFSSIDRNDTSTIHLLDANGQEVAYTYDLDALSSMEWQPRRTSFAIRTAPVQVTGPLTLVLDSVVVTVAVPLDTTFTFDPGSDPQPGQVWELNKDIEVGYGHSIQILRATYPEPPMVNLPVQPGFSFDIKSPTGVTQATLLDKDHPFAGGGGGGGSFAGIFSSGFSYAGEMPDGLITVRIESIVLIMLGTNDSKPNNWSAEVYERELVELVETYKSLPTAPVVYLLLPPAFVRKGKLEVAFTISDQAIEHEITPIMKRAAAKINTLTIDIFSATKEHPEYFQDGIHPNAAGNKAIAETVFAVLQDEPRLDSKN